MIVNSPIAGSAATRCGTGGLSLNPPMGFPGGRSGVVWVVGGWLVGFGGV